MKAYKGFNKDLTCIGYQYEIGKTYECEDAKVCDYGFHACLRPVDVLAYYAPARSRYCEVEVDEDGLSLSAGDSKVATRRITIVREISLRELHKAQLEYAREHEEECKTGGDGSSVTGGNGSSVTGGDGSSVTGGDGSSVTGGNGAVAASRGAIKVGGNGVAVCRGNGCKIRGGLGSVLVIVEENKNDYDIAAWKAVVVDGKVIKADTWYKLENGELIEAE